MVANTVSLAWISIFTTCAGSAPSGRTLRRAKEKRQTDQWTASAESAGLSYCHRTSLPPLFPPLFFVCSKARSPLSQRRCDGRTEHEGAICHSAPAPARVLRARRSPLTRLSCHVRWLTGKVTSGDKRPQLGSVSNPAFLTMHVCTRASRSICVLSRTRQKEMKKNLAGFISHSKGSLQRELPFN